MPASSLQFVDFKHADGTLLPGLVAVTQGDSAQLALDERIALNDAANFDEVDFVFFRRYADNRSSHLAAYVVDNHDERLNQDQLSKLHHRLWLHGSAPLLYIAWPTRIDVLTCARGPDFWVDNEHRYKTITKIQTAADIDAELRKAKRFSALRLADGTFWDEPQNAQFADYDKAAHQSLIQAIVQTDNELDGGRKPVMRRLLLLMVLMKYLEDRRVFPNGWFGRFNKGAKSFFEVLQGENPEEVQRLLAFLEKKFNGDVFQLPTTARNQLTKSSLRKFAQLVEAKTLAKQRYLWEQFSFEHIPVEIISHLYQRFVEGGHGKVYTPPFLASLLLDRAMPYEKLTGEERVLDPAFGSGVFLVGAFRRLVNVWRKNNNWRKPSVEVLKDILRQSIFGVELDSDAVDLAALSLAIAICDQLKPVKIWNELRLEPLRNRNLIPGDFFQLLLNSHENSETFLDDGFDVVIGNPPFESKITDAGKKIDDLARSSRGRLPDKQTAYLFLEQSLRALRPNGRVCLIQPHGLIYNLKAAKFRTSLIQNYQFQSVLDFVSIRGLFEAADAKTVAVLATGSDAPADNIIEHCTFRRTITVHKRICFELDHYDRHRVPQKFAETGEFIWRTNLVGGGRLFDISRRLRSLRTLSDYIDEKKWEYGEGFIAAKKERRAHAPFLTGKPYLPTEAFTESGIDENRIDIVRESLFRSAYTSKRYSSPLILVKELSSLPVAYWEKGFLAFRHKIVGIHAPLGEAASLRKLFRDMVARRTLYQFCLLVNGSQALIGKATAILKQDIDTLPYPEDEGELKLSFWECAIKNDVLNYMADYVRLGQNSPLLKTAANEKHLEAYAAIFVKMLRTVYGNLNADSPRFLDGLICQVFYFGDRPNLSWLQRGSEAELRALVYEQEHEHLRTVRVVRFYDENVIAIIKPDRLRYWIRSTAIRDADETLIDLRKQGY